MATKKKMLQAAAGNAGGEPGLDVSEVFSTYLYEGNGSNNTRSINNGLDLANEGGIIWTKNREQAADHVIFDPQAFPDGDHWIYVNLSTAPQDMGSRIFDTTSTGYQISNDNNRYNASSRDYVSWSFRKAPKFFDVVTWDGNNQSTRNISHNLGSVPGAMIVSGYTNAEDRWVYHRKMNASAPQNYAAKLHETGGASTEDRWRQTAPTDTQFTVDTDLNTSGRSYFAYLFAHNDGDGDFGPDGQQDIIKCGSFTTNGSGIGEDVDLGWEPQWLLVRSITNGDWKLIDTMRGYPAYKQSNNATQRLEAEDTAAEATQIFGGILSGTGFKIQDNSNTTYMYIAIRRGPMAVPEDATDVFDTKVVTAGSTTEISSDNLVDMSLNMYRSGSSNRSYFNDRVRNSGLWLQGENTNAEISGYTPGLDRMTGFETDLLSAGASVISHAWTRAPNFCDVVAYTGNGVAGHTVSHNLGVVPEMIWVKDRDQVKSWQAYLGPLGLSGGAPAYAPLNETDAAAYSSTRFYTTPTATEFSIGSNSRINTSGSNYIAYLFASLNGISKVGSYTGNGTSQTIDCGFTSGARFILIKRTNTTGSWSVFNTERGIVAGNDPKMKINSTQGEDSSSDYIDPDNSGFIVNYIADDDEDTNVDGDEYIFYAIA